MTLNALELPSDFTFTELADRAEGNFVSTAASDDIFAIEVDGPATTGAGDDTLIGTVTVDMIDEADTGLDFAGIWIANALNTEEDNDSVIGFADVGTEAVGTDVFGISLPVFDSLQTGIGNDQVIGVAFATGTELASVGSFGLGLGDSTINSGAGDDTIIGFASATSAATSAEAQGISLASPTVDSIIDTDSGADIVVGVAEAMGVEFTQAVGIDGSGGRIDTGDPIEDDLVVAIADASGGADTRAFGIRSVKVETGSGKDLVFAEATAVAGAGGVAVASGIIDSSIGSGAGMDTITAIASATMGDGLSHVGTAGIADSVITPGSEADEVLGSATVTVGDNSSYNAVIGISNTDIDDIDGTGDANSLTGMASATGGNGAAFDDIFGISTSSTWTLGDGNDSVTGSVTAGVGDNGSIGVPGGSQDDVVGIRNVTLVMDGGDNVVVGSADVGGGSGTVIDDIDGMADVTVTTGDGNNQIIGVVSASVTSGGQIADAAGGGGILDSNLTTGGGDDQVIGVYEATGGSGTVIENASGIRIGDVDVGEGANLVVGLVTASVPDGGSISLNFGINNTDTIFGGDNDDVVAGITVSEGGAGTVISDNPGINDSVINTGAGNDVIIGQATITGTGLATAWSDGINDLSLDDSLIAGTGEDLVVGIGANVAVSGSSYGINGYGLIDLGSDDDLIVSRGATAGVNNVNIDGGTGDDVFDLHSGTTRGGGQIDGGEGGEANGDLLILAGDSTDFAFAAGPGEAGNISGGDTDLDVDKIEMFQFDDGLFTFADLFGP